MIKAAKLLQQKFLFYLIFFLFISCDSEIEKKLSDSRPNIILCMSDDQGWGDIAYQEHPILKTPNMNKMAENGLRMDRFYAASAVCSPTRVSVLTGRHGNRMGTFNFGYPIAKDEITLAHILKEKGYATAHFGKWHIGSIHKESEVNPGKMGFDYWLSAVNFFDNDPLLSRNGKIERISGEGSDILVEEALDYIKTQENKGKPYFVVIWFASPHVPHMPTRKNSNKYKDSPQMFRNFFGEISDLDDAIGKLRMGIRSSRNYENTLIWYNGDNGGMPVIGRNGGRASKGSIYEGGLRVPCIIEWPAMIKENRISNYSATTSDILPTILELCSIKYEFSKPLDGMSIANTIRNASNSTRKEPVFFWDCRIPGRYLPKSELMDSLFVLQELGMDSILMKRPEFKTKKKVKQIHKLKGHAAILVWPLKLHQIKEINGPVKYELYNLENDPFERLNWFYKLNKKSIKLKKQLHEWQESVVKSYNEDEIRIN